MFQRQNSLSSGLRRKIVTPGWDYELPYSLFGNAFLQFPLQTKPVSDAYGFN